MVRHCSVGTLIFEENQEKTILVIKRTIELDRPNSYQISFKSPVHDGYNKKNFLTTKKIIKIKWEEYEDYFLNEVVASLH